MSFAIYPFAAGAALAGVLLTGSASAAPAAAKPLPYKEVMAAEARSAELCEAKPGRIFVTSGKDSECIAYFVTKGHESRRKAVLFLDGDVAPEKYVDAAAMERSLAQRLQHLQAWADKLKVRYVFVARAGVNGSSGDHGKRRLPKETMIMNAAVDLLKQRLGLDRLTLAGQSGGSTIAASLMSLGRTDVDCAVLGSGAFELVELRHKDLTSNGYKVTRAEIAKVSYDPSAHVGEIKPAEGRRVLVLGDEADSRTPFDQQRRYVESLVARGHHARLLAIDATDDNNHGATGYTIPTAGACLNGVSDEKIAKAVGEMSRKTTESAMKSAGTVAVVGAASGPATSKSIPSAKVTEATDRGSGAKALPAAASGSLALVKASARQAETGLAVETTTGVRR